MTFYQKCLGGVLRFQSTGSTPLSKEISARMKRSILQGTLRNGKMLLVGTDMVSEIGLIKRHTLYAYFYIVRMKKSKVVVQKIISTWKSSATIGSKPLWHTDRGLTDKYGYHWTCNVALISQEK